MLQDSNVWSGFVLFFNRSFETIADNRILALPFIFHNYEISEYPPFILKILERKIGSSNCLLILYFELVPVSLRLSNIMGDNIVPFCFSLIFIVFWMIAMCQMSGWLFCLAFFRCHLEQGWHWAPSLVNGSDYSCMNLTLFLFDRPFGCPFLSWWEGLV